MQSGKKISVRKLTILFTSALTPILILKGRGKQRVTFDLSKMDSIPAGRYILDLPVVSNLSWGRQGYQEAGPFIRSFKCPSFQDLSCHIHDRIIELRYLSSKGEYAIQSTITRKQQDSIYILYNNRIIENIPYVDIDGFFWKQGYAFSFSSDAFGTPEDIQHRVDLLQRHFGNLVIREEREIPKERGFCIDHAFFRGDPSPDTSEHIALHANFQSHPDLFIRFTTNTLSRSTSGQARLLERNAAGRQNLTGLHAGIRELRSGDRQVRHLRGQEVVKRIRESNFTVGYTFMWECVGEPENALRPSISLQMVTGFGSPPRSSSLNRKEAFALWDRVLDSIRYRETEATFK